MSEFLIAIPHLDNSEENDGDDANELVNYDNIFNDKNETEVLAAQGNYITITLNNSLFIFWFETKSRSFIY